jgi:tRNA 2-thiouridine synthesizing protein A
MVETKAEKVLDLRGLICPRPMIMTMSILKTMEKNQIVHVICSDNSTKHSLPGLCERGGFRLLEIKEDSGIINFFIQK